MLVLILLAALSPMIFLPKLIGPLTSESHAESKWLDGLRGLAATIVALNHAPLVLINLNLVPKEFYFNQTEISLFRFFGSFGVQIFFCITGVLFAGKIFKSEDIEWVSFFRKRIYCIVPAYFFACTVALTVALWHTWPLNQPKIELASSLPALFSFGMLPLPDINGLNMAHLIGINWTLAIEWRFYLLMPILVVLFKGMKRLALVLLFLFAASDTYITGASSWVYFISGAVCVPVMKMKFSKQVKVVFYALMLSVIVAYCLYWWKFVDYGYERWALMTMLFLSVVVTRPVLLKISPLVAMGTVSYSFYLFHSMTLFILFDFCNSYLFDVAALSVREFTLLAGASLAAATLLATASYMSIERPFMKAATRRSATSRELNEGRNEANDRNVQEN